MKSFVVAGAVVALASGTPAFAEQVLADQPKIVSLLQAKGYKAELIEGSDADYVRTGDSGVPITIFFLNCANGKRGCTTLQFYTGFSKVKSTPDQINSWNREQRWARAYIDKSNDPVIEMDVNMDFGGTSRELFYDNLATFIGTIPLFREHLKK